MLELYTNISSIFKTAKFIWSFTVIYKCTNDSQTVFKQICGSNKGRLSYFDLHYFQQPDFAVIQLPLLLLFLEMGVAFTLFQRKGGVKFELTVRGKGKFSKTSNTGAYIR